MSETLSNSAVLSKEMLLEHWQGHRRLTRKVLEVFPDDQLFQFSIGGMRPFSQLTLEFIKMAEPIARGIATGEWKEFDKGLTASSKQDLLQLWDAGTEALNRIWPTIPVERFQAVDKAFGQWEMPCYAMALYAIDNEVHHRGQGYVYLRALGVEPPPFWER
jgi:uncharacterized damage-inducible protein DinB